MVLLGAMRRNPKYLSCATGTPAYRYVHFSFPTHGETFDATAVVGAPEEDRCDYPTFLDQRDV